jgi:hypothetical protein
MAIPLLILTPHPLYIVLLLIKGLSMFFWIQRALLALCLLLLLLGCSTPTCREWEIQEIVTQTPSFNGGRLILGPDSDYSHLELELVRSSSGIRFYINLLFLQALPWQDDPTRTCISILFADQEPWIVYPYLLEGSQRLLLPGDVADILVQSLIDDLSFIIQIGRSQISVVPTNFIKAYQRLLDLSIEENIFLSDLP